MINNSKNEDFVLNHYNSFLYSVCFNFKLNFEYIETLVEEIHASEFNKLEKSILTESLVEILNDYLIINSPFTATLYNFKYIDINNNSIEVTGFDAPIAYGANSKLKSIFDSLDFKEIYKLMKKFLLGFFDSKD